MFDPSGLKTPDKPVVVEEGEGQYSFENAYAGQFEFFENRPITFGSVVAPIGIADTGTGSRTSDLDYLLNHVQDRVLDVVASRSGATCAGAAVPAVPVVPPSETLRGLNRVEVVKHLLELLQAVQGTADDGVRDELLEQCVTVLRGESLKPDEAVAKPSDRSGIWWRFRRK